MLVGLHVATNFEMYRQNSEKALLAPSPLSPPPPGYANGWQCQGSRYNALAGNLRAKRAANLKILVCLVVFFMLN